MQKTINTPDDILAAYGNSFPVDMEHVAAALGFNVIDADMRKYEDSTRLGIRTVTVLDGGTADILVNDKYVRDEDRRYAIAHAIGYWMLFTRHETGNKVTAAFENDRRTREQKARGFALKLLMPKAEVKREYDKMIIPVACTIQKKFGVRLRDAYARLDQLDLDYI